MRTIIHNILSILRRYKKSATLNILGLSVAFTGFMILMMQVSYDYGYDRFHKNSNRLYRVELQQPEGIAQAVFPRPLIESFFNSSPHILESSLMCRWWDSEKNVAVEYNGERSGFREMHYLVSPGYSKVFDFDIIAGDVNTLEYPDKVLIPQSMAKRFFPDGMAVGNKLDGEELKAEIGGIYGDFPENSLVENAIYQKIPDNHGAGEWTYHNYEAFILLDDAANKDGIVENFESNFRPNEYEQKENKIRLTNIPDVYYKTDVIFDSQKSKGSRLQLFVLTSIAILMLLIAAVNFTNFSNALVPLRLKNINTQKVLGCAAKELRFSMLAEAMFLCLVSFLLALLILLLLSDSHFAGIVSGGIRLANHTTLLLATAFIALFTGLIAGLWPAWYITSFQPALVLKGNFGLSLKDRSIRSFLVGLQFVFTFVLIVVAVFISLQNKHMMSSVGFEKDQIAIIRLNKNLGKNIDVVRQQLRSLPEIEEVAIADRMIGGNDTYTKIGRTYEGEGILFELIRTDPSIFTVLNIPITEGRGFVEDDYVGDGAYIFNETARRKWNLEVGKTMNLDWGNTHLRERIVGFTEDIKYNSYRNELSPFAFYAVRSPLMEYALIRIHAGTNYSGLIQSVNKVLTGIDPDYPLEINLFDQVLENLYQKELLLGNQILFFSLLVIFISLIGVFGIVLFESEYKKREISIRKVFGSTIGEVILLLNNQYVRILVVCFLLASPIAYFAVSEWLQNFAYKTPIYLWVFVFAFMGITFLTLLTVSFQNWRVAKTNPIDSLYSL